MFVIPASSLVIINTIPIVHVAISCCDTLLLHTFIHIGALPYLSSDTLGVWATETQWFIYLFSASSTRKLIVYKLIGGRNKCQQQWAFIAGIYHFVYHSTAEAINFALFSCFRLLTEDRRIAFLCSKFLHIYRQFGGIKYEISVKSPR